MNDSNQQQDRKNTKFRSERFWNRLSKTLDKSMPSHGETLKKIIHYLNSGDTVLDIGCATGILTSEIAGYVTSVHGIDISSEMITVAKKKAEQNNQQKAIYSHADIFNAQLTDESFDTIIALNLLHFIDDLTSYVGKINTLLKTGGLFISLTPVKHEGFSLSRSIIGITSALGIIPKTNIVYSVDLIGIIEKRGFEILEFESTRDFRDPHCFIVAKKNR